MTDKTGPHAGTTGLVHEQDDMAVTPTDASTAAGESHERLGQRLASAEAALDLAGVGCWDWEIGTPNVAWTSTMEKLWGFAPGEFDGTLDAVAARITEGDRQRWQESVRATLEEGREHRIDMRLQLPGGSHRWVEALGNVVYDAGGKPLRMMGTCQDITERKQVELAQRRSEAERASLQLQLAQAQKMDSIGRLAGGVAHDFNNLLQAIIGHAELMQFELPGGSPLCEHVDQILRTAQRSADLTRQLLAFASKQTVSPRVLYVNEIVGNTLGMLQRLIGEHIQVLWQPGQALPPVFIDAVQLEQMLTNVILNARDAIDDYGCITVTTDVLHLPDMGADAALDRKPGVYTRLCVRDDGAGMDADVLKRVFEPFFTTKDMGKGTGLGMAMVYGAVQQNRGFIEIESAPGAGTTVSICLPCSSADAVATEVVRSGAQPAAPGCACILVVEDEPVILSIANDILQHLGHRVLKAASPAVALALWQRHADEIDIVLTDVIMPGMNGQELVERLRQTRPDVRCIFMSGYPSDVVAQRGLLAPDVNFVHKPFDIRTLGACVAQVLKR